LRSKEKRQASEVGQKENASSACLVLVVPDFGSVSFLLLVLVLVLEWEKNWRREMKKRNCSIPRFWWLIFDYFHVSSRIEGKRCDRKKTASSVQ